MHYAGYYNLSTPNSLPSSRITTPAASRRASDKSVTSTTSSEPQASTERRPSFFKRALDQLKPLDEPILVDGVWSPMFANKAERQAAEKADKEARKAKKEAAKAANEKGMSKAQYELISAAA